MTAPVPEVARACVICTGVLFGRNGVASLAIRSCKPHAPGQYGDRPNWATTGGMLRRPLLCGLLAVAGPALVAGFHDPKDAKSQQSLTAANHDESVSHHELKWDPESASHHAPKEDAPKNAVAEKPRSHETHHSTAVPSATHHQAAIIAREHLDAAPHAFPTEQTIRTEQTALDAAAVARAR